MTDERAERPRRINSTHESRTRTRAGVTYRCPGVPCGHERRCCALHGVHVTSHTGCIRR